MSFVSKSWVTLRKVLVGVLAGDGAIVAFTTGELTVWSDLRTSLEKMMSQNRSPSAADMKARFLASPST